MVTNALLDLLSDFLGSVLSNIVGGLLLLALGEPVMKRLSRKKPHDQDQM
ncbi:MULTISPECIES: hypothetical protein [unclassified Streptomyces]|nr:hypothetical protein [Streptomyces sp. sk2.1]